MNVSGMIAGAVVYLLLILLVSRLRHLSGVLLACGGKSSRVGVQPTCILRESAYSEGMANVPPGSDSPRIVRGYGIVPQPAPQPARPARLPVRTRARMLWWVVSHHA